MFLIMNFPKKNKGKEEAITKRRVSMEKVEATSKKGRTEDKEGMEKNTSKNQVPLVVDVLFARNLVMSQGNVVLDALDAKFLITLKEIAGTKINKRKMMPNLEMSCFLIQQTKFLFSIQNTNRPEILTVII